jgi:hypothetical protein
MKSTPAHPKTDLSRPEEQGWPHVSVGEKAKSFRHYGWPEKVIVPALL